MRIATHRESAAVHSAGEERPVGGSLTPAYEGHLGRFLGCYAVLGVRVP